MVRRLRYESCVDTEKAMKASVRISCHPAAIALRRAELRTGMVFRACLMLVALLLPNREARADFHDWRINEIYSNGDGSVQFVELSCPVNDENLLGGQRLFCSDGSQTKTFVFPSNLATTFTANKTLLLATS